MNKDICQRIASVINALNNVYVKGEQNLSYLSGSIALLREVLDTLSKEEVANLDKTEG